MLSREEIKAVYDQGPDAVITLVEGIITTFQQQIEALQAQVKELQNRLALNSSNSSKPPSSNPPAPRTKSLRTPSGKKPGAQLDIRVRHSKPAQRRITSKFTHRQRATVAVRV